VHGPGGEQRRILLLGQWLRWRLTGPRSCIGVWSTSAQYRTPCPTRAHITERGTDAQCPGCAAADRGRAIARDSSVADDGRTYLLYLAWFGDGLLKVGLTAAERDTDRLLDQAAIAYTLLARGPYTPIRRAERTISTAGLAAERISARAKADAWWDLTDTTAALTTAHRLISDVLISATFDPLELLPLRIVDQRTIFGLHLPVPDAYAEVTAVGDGTAISGRILAVPGQRLLLDTQTGPLLLDARLISGWAVATATGTVVGGFTTRQRSREKSLDDDHQDTLF
jgi:hypothetical protein